MRFLFALFFLCLAVVPGRSALPPLAYVGSLKGEITLPTLPLLSWTLVASPASKGTQSAAFSLNGEGVVVRATLQADENTGLVTWKIDDARVQLGTWFAGLAKRYAPSVGSVTASGELILSGEGTLDNLKPTGSLHVRFENATVRDHTAGWTLEGVTFAGAFSLGPDLSIASATPFDFGIRTITTSRLGARAFSTRGRLTPLSTVAVEAARVEIAGGEVDADPFTAPLSPLSIETRVHVKRIGLQDFAQLFPSGLAEARGRLDGDLSLAWAAESGFHIGVGTLSLDEFEPTVFRLAPAPGLLTSGLSARIEFVPGRLGRWFSIRNDVYDDLREIELGHADLRINSLRAFLTPDGDAEGRSARVFIDAGPVKQDGAVKQVIFTVNVAGPLSKLLNFMMPEGIASFETH